MKNIRIINGPNLNLLGKRETSIYGEKSFEDFLSELKTRTTNKLEYLQSNHEGEIIDAIHQNDGIDAILINAGGYTHTSVAIRDAIAGIKIPVIEIHISNVTKRESFRHESLLTPVCAGCIFGFGLLSYELGIEAVDRM